MRIALLSYEWGEYCIRLASALAQQAKVYLCIPEKQARPHLSKLNPAVRFHAFHEPRLRQPVRQFATIATLLRILREFEPDVIYIQQGHLCSNVECGHLGWPSHQPLQNPGKDRLYDMGEVYKAADTRLGSHVPRDQRPGHQESGGVFDIG